MFEKITSCVDGVPNVPTIRLCNTRDECQSYKARQIPLTALVTDSDNFIQQSKDAAEVNCPGTVVYATSNTANFSNFVMSLSKSLYAPLRGQCKLNKTKNRLYLKDMFSQFHRLCLQYLTRPHSHYDTWVTTVALS